MCARTVQNSLRSVIVADPGSRARSRRYLQPGFGCLRCNRGRSWASARTRYLQWCLRCSRCSSRRYLVSWPSAGLPGDLRSEHLKLPDRPLRKVTWEARQRGRFRRYPGRYLCLHPRTPGHRGQAGRSAGPPAARAPEAARQHCLFSIKKSLQRATDRHGRPAAPAAGKPCPCTRKALCALSRGDMSTPQKRLPTGHYLQTTSDNRRSGRRPGSAVAAQMPRRMRQSARLRPSRCPSGGADARFRRSFDLRNARRVTMRRPGWHATASRPWTSGLSMVVLPSCAG